MENTIDEVVYTAEQIENWRRRVGERREELFKKSWKNQRVAAPQPTREQERSIQIIVEWVEDFDDVVGRAQERAKLDTLLGRGSGAK